MLKSGDEKGITVEEMYTNAQVLIVAGSETTAAGLTVATYFLLSNPSTWLKVCAEVRDNFSKKARSPAKILLASLTSKLPLTRLYD